MEIKKTIKSPLVMLAIVLLVSGSFYSIVKLSGYTYVHSIISLVAMPLIIVSLAIKAIKNKNEKTKAYVFFSALLSLIAFFHVAAACVASDLNVYTIFIYDIAYASVVLICGLKLFFACVKARVVRSGLGIVVLYILLHRYQYF
jgi:hypothetical protein